MALQVANGLDIPPSYFNDKQARVFTGFIYDIFRKAKITNKITFPYYQMKILYTGGRNGVCDIIPKTAFVASKALEKMDASSIHAAGELEISDWKDRLVSLGCKSGVVVRLEKDVPELIAIHRCSHRFELAVKAVVKEVTFYKTVNTFLVDLYKATILL